VLHSPTSLLDNFPKATSLFGILILASFFKTCSSPRLHTTWQTFCQFFYCRLLGCSASANMSSLAIRFNLGSSFNFETPNHDCIASKSRKTDVVLVISGPDHHLLLPVLIPHQFILCDEFIGESTSLEPKVQVKMAGPINLASTR
jgi:hypothetical protein